MRLGVKLFASLCARVPGARAGVAFEVELDEGATVADLIDHLGIPRKEAHVTFVNGRSRPDDWPLEAGDQAGIFPPIGGGSMSAPLDVWLYGADLAQHAGEADRGSYAHLEVQLPEGSTVADLLAHLNVPTEARGITFINGQLSAMPGLQPDLDHTLVAGDRVAFFHLRSMWPFQYRHGAALTDEMNAALAEHPDEGRHHSYRTADGPD